MCDYCEKAKPLYFYGKGNCDNDIKEVYIDNGNLYINCIEYDSMQIKIKYCPMCGKCI